MKINQNTKLIGNNVVLVPYEHDHVPKYHAWMQSAELQELTASQPLSVEEEYAMQKSWREDEDKCTFIILDKQKFDVSNNEIESMVGDTNLFIDSQEGDKAEIEIMIAESSARGKRLGWEATIGMLLYGIEKLNSKLYQAKILFTNEISIKMFEKLGFKETQRIEVFKEVTLEKEVDSSWTLWLKSNCNFKEAEYKINEKILL